MSTPSERRPTPEGTTVHEAVEDYLRYKIKADGSETTMRSPLESFADHCKDERGVGCVGELADQDIRSYSEHLYDRVMIDENLAASTANAYFAYVRAFLSWCVREQHLEQNPANTNTAMDPLPEDDGKRKTQYWSEDDRQQLEAYATKRVDMALEGTIRTDPKAALRDRAIVVMLGGTGARGAELFADPKDDKRPGLRWSDVDFEQRLIEVYGKSREYEEAPFPDSVHNVLERWYDYLEPPTDEWPVFPTGHYGSKEDALIKKLGEERVNAALKGGGDEGKTAVLDRLHREHEVPPPSISKEGVRRLLKRLTKEANIDPDGDYDYLTLHGARRALGRDLYANGMSEKAQEALRHKSIETTHEAYTDLQMKDVSNSIDEVRD
ncbi:integrase family protein (plasmid) [Haloterrigena turkmenica DSM 5511]|uniref:Integrase family protein n=1 Tax=Haloterrigena turkmenica (strain ATCC 51198 / DSM 5511 / JCM 9101 / NCIMB 13204 / VKM B-1734 / 4k) TaxID=543526 RepID=D2S2M2_HALTV|nr:tyrosine-type recombinase/integrase [Haloterrigena turkmenica]ADB63619.1 integrase family protein [Haloterrigena turkmenica DSM 5511]